MIIEEAYGENLVYHYSDEGYRLRQRETGIIYDEAIDIIPCPYTYEETDEKIDGSDLSDKAEAYDILIGEQE